MAFGIVTWNPIKISTFNTFAAIWDYDGLPLAEQTMSHSMRHVKVMVDDSKISKFKESLKRHGLDFKKL
jgi:hypothetical protein